MRPVSSGHLLGQAGRVLGTLIGILAIGTYGLALFELVLSFVIDHPEASFDQRVFAAILALYGTIFLAFARAFWTGTLARWLPLLGLLGFLLPALTVAFSTLVDGLLARSLTLDRLWEQIIELYGPPFTAIHAYLYSCLALSLLALLWPRRRLIASRQP